HRRRPSCRFLLEREPFRRAVVPAFARLPAFAPQALRRVRRSCFVLVATGAGKASRSFYRNERPPSLGRRGSETPRAERRDVGPPRRLVAPPRRVRARERAQRVKRVVGDEPAPHERPQRVDRFRGIAAADRVVQRTEKRRAAIAKRLENRELARVRITVRLREDTYLGVLIVRGVRL